MHRGIERVSLESEEDVRMFERVARTCGARVGCFNLSSAFMRHAPTSRLWNWGPLSLASITEDCAHKRRNQPARPDVYDAYWR